METFWRSLWQADDKGDPTAKWINDFRCAMTNIVPDLHDGELEVTSIDCFRAVGKKKNWSAAGPDKITNYWWKKLTSTLPVVTYSDILLTLNLEYNVGTVVVVRYLSQKKVNGASRIKGR